MGPEANRAIVLTASQPAAIAVVRLSGPAVGEFLRRHFSASVAPGRCVHGTLRDGKDVIDDPVVVLTGRGDADINVHGGPWVVREVVELARREGFGVLALSEAEGQAVDAEDPLEEEMLTHLPLAMTEEGLRMLLAQPAAWRRDHSGADAAAVLADRSLWWMLHPPTVAIVGPPNAGKSTLANRLYGQERSITADMPGTTRDWVGDLANLGGLPVMLLDTPGLRQTGDEIEREAIRHSGDRIAAADLVMLLLDATAPWEEQSPVVASHPSALVVVNKVDCPAAWDLDRLPCLRTVATTGQGVAEVAMAVRRHFGCADLAPDRRRWWTSRQKAVLEAEMGR